MGREIKLGAQCRVSNKKRFRFFLGLLLGLGLLFAVAKFVNLAHALEESSEYPWSNLALVLLISLGYYLFKALRWHYLLTVLDIRLPFRRSILTYLGGQWFAFSPAGEFVRAYLLVPLGYGFTRSSAVVTIQIVFDLLSLAVVASVAVFWFRGMALLVLPFTALLVVVILALLYGRRMASWNWFPSAIFSRVASWRSWSVFYGASLQLLGWRPILIGSALGVLATISGAAILHLISLDYRMDVAFGQSTYVYTLSQLVGALSMLPHGLGAVEGSSVALYSYAGVDAAHAASTVVLFRLCTVGWGLLLGGASLISLRTPLAGPSAPIVGQADLASE